jgi:hypothetical protein
MRRKQRINTTTLLTMLTLDAITIDSFVMVRMLEDEMAKTDDDRETSLRIENLELDKSMASELLRFFQNCSEHDGLEMDKLVIDESLFNLCLVSVLYAVMSMDLFKELSLSFYDKEDLSLGLLQALRKGPIETPIKLLTTLGIKFVDLTPTFLKVFRDIVGKAKNLESLSLAWCSGLLNGNWKSWLEPAAI